MSSVKPTSGPSPMRLYCFDGGRITWPQGNFTHLHGWGTFRSIPIPFFLIDHPEGKVLFETGMHSDVATDPVVHYGETRARNLDPRMKPEQAVERQLATLGVKPKDIRYVIISALFSDHAGGMQVFPDATFIIQFRKL